MKSVSIIGVGRVGGAFALALDNKGYLIENLITRSTVNANYIAKQIESNPTVCKFSDVDEIPSDIILVSTQDSEIENIVSQLATKKLGKKTYVFHTSGSISSAILERVKGNNCFIGSIHPLVSISDSHLGVKRFRDAFFCVEGDVEAVELAKVIVKDLGGKPFTIETKYKTLYHSSAVMACGHIVALIDTSMEMLQKCGLDSDSSKEILMPLIKSTIENLAEQKNSEALTGTFARADFETLEKHIDTIGVNNTDEVLEIYLNLGSRSLNLAKEQGISADKLEKMSQKISLAKKNLKC